MLLDIILSNALSLDCHFLCNCAQVSKDHKSLVQTLWRKANYKLPENYNRVIDEYGNCQFCPRYANTPFACCRRCLKYSNIISATDSKKQWFLENKDLDNLTVYHTIHAKYKKPIRLFYLPEVTRYAVSKHTPKVLYTLKHKPKNKPKRVNELTRGTGSAHH
jgi:hypothetical protein